MGNSNIYRTFTLHYHYMLISVQKCYSKTEVMLTTKRDLSQVGLSY